MDRKGLWAMLLCCLVILLALAIPFVWQTWGRCDATIYASGFSEAKFRQIRTGLSRAEVRRILGEPLTNDQKEVVKGLRDDENKRFYADLGHAKIPEDDRVTNTWYETREVDFDRQGLVERTVSSTQQFE